MITCIHCRATLSDREPHADDCRSREIIDHKMAAAILRRLESEHDAASRP